MTRHQMYNMMDKLAEHNRAKLIAIIAIAKRQAGLSVMWDDVPVFPDDMGWRIRIIKMIKDLCWFYDRMEGEHSPKLEVMLNEIIMEIRGQE